MCVLLSWRVRCRYLGATYLCIYLHLKKCGAGPPSYAALLLLIPPIFPLAPGTYAAHAAELEMMSARDEVTAAASAAATARAQVQRCEVAEWEAEEMKTAAAAEVATMQADARGAKAIAQEASARADMLAAQLETTQAATDAASALAAAAVATHRGGAAATTAMDAYGAAAAAATAAAASEVAVSRRTLAKAQEAGAQLLADIAQAKAQAAAAKAELHGLLMGRRTASGEATGRKGKGGPAGAQARVVAKERIGELFAELSADGAAEEERGLKQSAEPSTPLAKLQAAGRAVMTDARGAKAIALRSETVRQTLPAEVGAVESLEGELLDYSLLTAY